MAKYILSDIFKGDYPISQKFAARPEYYKKFTIFGVQQKGHEGVDFATPVGVPILAPFTGIVLREDFQSDFRNYGKVVVLWDKAQKCAVWFCHLNQENVAINQTVMRGQPLGITGNTGNVQGDHLHFGMVETDIYGNRLHAYDGFGGFIDPLNPANVEWKLGGGQPMNDTQKVNAITVIMQGKKPIDSEGDRKIREVLGL